MLVRILFSDCQLSKWSPKTVLLTFIYERKFFIPRHTSVFLKIHLYSQKATVKNIHSFPKSIYSLSIFFSHVFSTKINLYNFFFFFFHFLMLTKVWVKKTIFVLAHVSSEDLLNHFQFQDQMLPPQLFLCKLKGQFICKGLIVNRIWCHEVLMAKPYKPENAQLDFQIPSWICKWRCF